MGTTNKHYDVDDSTGATKQIAAYDRRSQILLRSAGPDRVHFAFNETAVVTDGVFLDIGDALVLDGAMAKRDIYMVCASGEAATIFAELE